MSNVFSWVAAKGQRVSFSSNDPGVSICLVSYTNHSPACHVYARPSLPSPYLWEWDTPPGLETWGLKKEEGEEDQMQQRMGL